MSKSLLKFYHIAKIFSFVYKIVVSKHDGDDSIKTGRRINAISSYAHQRSRWNTEKCIPTETYSTFNATRSCQREFHGKTFDQKIL